MNKINDAGIYNNYIIDLPSINNSNLIQEGCERFGMDYDEFVTQNIPTSTEIFFAQIQKAIIKTKEQDENSLQFKQQFVTKAQIFQSQINVLLNKAMNSHIQFTHRIALMFQKLSQNQEQE
ncbi:Hypothetical_protein [Hexamita inflata]|uniref:Hypothetical_protein n=1 Tax=Hexamita inflata TaxID=28002 RepID=A0AA86UXF7_9EUKA|nr:Hypothetical protein HINF_LOCUS63435 [Hexamita inflata]